MLSLADVLELPVVRRALPELITGSVERELRWSHVIEMRDPDDLLKGGELVLTTGLGAGDEPAHQATWIKSLIEQGMAALAVELGTSWRAVPPVVVEACSVADVPVLAFHRAVRFIDITEAVHSAVLHAQFDLLRRGEEIHRRFTELILQGRGAPEILAELAAAVGNPVLLEDAAHALVYYVSGPPGDDLALSAWTDARRGGAGGGARGGAGGDGRRRRAADGLLVGAPDRAGAGQGPGRVRPRGGRAGGAGGRDRPARPAARRAAARALARSVPVRSGRRARRRGGRRAAAGGRARLRLRARRAAGGGRGLARGRGP